MRFAERGDDPGSRRARRLLMAHLVTLCRDEVFGNDGYCRDCYRLLKGSTGGFAGEKV